MRKEIVAGAAGIALTLAVLGGCGASQQDGKTAKAAVGETAPDRTVLPIAEPDYPRSTELDARNAKAPPGLK